MMPRANANNLQVFARWFGQSRARAALSGESSRDATFTPQMMFHTTKQGGFSRFEIGRPGVNSNTFGEFETRRHAIFVTPSVVDSNSYGIYDSQFVTGATTMPVYIRAISPLDMTEGISEADEARLVTAGFSERFIHNHLHRWESFDDEDGELCVKTLERAGFDSVVYFDENPDTHESFEAWALFSPDQIVSAIDFPEARGLVLPPLSLRKNKSQELALEM